MEGRLPARTLERVSSANGGAPCALLFRLVGPPEAGTLSAAELESHRQIDGGQILRECANGDKVYAGLRKFSDLL